MLKMKMAALFGRKLISQFLHYLESMVGIKIRKPNVIESIYIGFKLIHVIGIQDG